MTFASWVFSPLVDLFNLYGKYLRTSLNYLCLHLHEVLTVWWRFLHKNFTFPAKFHLFLWIFCKKTVWTKKSFAARTCCLSFKDCKLSITIFTRHDFENCNKFEYKFNDDLSKYLEILVNKGCRRLWKHATMKPKLRLV